MGIPEDQVADLSGTPSTPSKPPSGPPAYMQRFMKVKEGSDGAGKKEPEKAPKWYQVSPSTEE